jgi:hypothetical protein
VNAARHDIEGADDFRLRMAAALALGRAKPSDARVLLEKALSDPHPAVRTAAAASLTTLHDPAAIPALERNLAGEGSASVKSQMRSSIDALRGGGAAHAPTAKYLVQLGAMKNLTSVRGEQLGQVLRTAARERAASIPGAMLSDDAAAAKLAGVPTLVLDGSVLQLSQSRANGNITFSAQVEFSVRKVPEHTLRATLTGAATTLGTQVSLNGHQDKVSALQDQAVDGAVQSAMRGASSGLTAALSSAR